MASKKAEDVNLVCITRPFDGDIPLMKTVRGLSRPIMSKDLTPTLGKHLQKEGKCSIREDILLALDLSDVSAEYSEEQESLA